MGLWSLFGQVSNMLPLGQRQKVQKVHLLIRRRSCERQESLGPILATLFFNGSNAICLEMMGVRGHLHFHP